MEQEQLSEALALEGAGIKRVTVTLLNPHTHDGIDYEQAAVDAGVMIEVSEAQAQWLYAMGVI